MKLNEIHLIKKSFNNKFLIIFKTDAHYLHHRFINQKIKCKDKGYKTLQKPKMQAFGNRKNIYIFFNYLISEIPSFS